LGFVLEKKKIRSQPNWTNFEKIRMNCELNSVKFQDVKHKICFGPHQNGRISLKFGLIRSNPRTLHGARRHVPDPGRGRQSQAHRQRPVVGSSSLIVYACSFPSLPFPSLLIFTKRSFFGIPDLPSVEYYHTDYLAVSR
jgi:hypothetical protein